MEKWRFERHTSFGFCCNKFALFHCFHCAFISVILFLWRFHWNEIRMSSMNHERVHRNSTLRNWVTKSIPTVLCCVKNPRNVANSMNELNELLGFDEIKVMNAPSVWNQISIEFKFFKKGVMNSHGKGQSRLNSTRYSNEY